jgi:hypothetical protein
MSFYGTFLGREVAINSEAPHHSKKLSGVYGGMSRIDNTIN